MDEGSYGTCAECGEPIASRRLAAIPWASHCIRCQEALDRRNHRRAASPIGTRQHRRGCSAPNCWTKEVYDISRGAIAAMVLFSIRIAWCLNTSTSRRRRELQRREQFSMKTRTFCS